MSMHVYQGLYGISTLFFREKQVLLVGPELKEHLESPGSMVFRVNLVVKEKTGTMVFLDKEACLERME